ncbi:unnamed protein product, partial [Meganyctiphanes norvegica]
MSAAPDDNRRVSFDDHQPKLINTSTNVLAQHDEKDENNGHKDDFYEVQPGVSSINLVDPAEPEVPKELWGGRHTLALLGFLGIAVVYAMRVNLSVAIVAMVKSKSNDSIHTEVCPVTDNSTDTGDEGGGEYDWDEGTQGLILGCFFYGYWVTNLIGGRAAEYFGGKLVFGVGIVATAVLTVISPVSVQDDPGFFIAIRVLEGATEGVTFPAMSYILASWMPPLERSKFSTLVYSGVQFGTIVTMPISGWLCDSDFLGGWPSVFYLFGGLGIIWGVAWFLLIHDDPQKHPRISQAEKDYILKHCGAKSEKPVAIPWREMVVSLPVWAAAIMHFGNNWGFYTLLTELPTYLKNIQHFDMKSNGVFSALPYLVMWIFSIIYGMVIDQLLNRGKVSNIFVRRMSMAIGAYGPMLGLVVMCFVDCDSTLAMVVLCFAVGLNGAIYCGYMCSSQDLAPNFAGTIMGITNTLATIPGFAAPAVIGAITKDNQTLPAWRAVFLLSSVVYLITATFYIVFIKADVQSWNEPKDNKNTEHEMKSIGKSGKM